VFFASLLSASDEWENTKSRKSSFKMNKYIFVEFSTGFLAYSSLLLNEVTECVFAGKLFVATNFSRHRLLGMAPRDSRKSGYEFLQVW